MGWTPDNGSASRRDAGEADRQVDRRWLKRQVVLWRSLALVVATVLVTILVFQFGHGGGIGGGIGGSPHIARLTVSGVIQTDPQLLAAIDGLAKADSVRAVIVRIDSPGGTYSGSEALHAALRQLANEKPVVAVLDGVAASGGYMAALAADHIVARAGSITGSVGVIMQMPQLKGLMDSIGIDMEVVRSAPLKAAPSPFEDTTEAARAASESIVQDLFDQFVSLLTERRALEPAALETVKSGRVFTGRQALPLNLIDVIGGEDEARDWITGQTDIAQDIPIIDVPEIEDDAVLQELLKRLGGASLFAPHPTVDGPWAIWHPLS
jgi:protease-4